MWDDISAVNEQPSWAWYRLLPRKSIEDYKCAKNEFWKYGVHIFTLVVQGVFKFAITDRGTSGCQYVSKRSNEDRSRNASVKC